MTEREFILLDYLDKKKEASFSELSALFKKMTFDPNVTGRMEIELELL